MHISSGLSRICCGFPLLFVVDYVVDVCVETMNPFIVNFRTNCFYFLLRVSVCNLFVVRFVYAAAFRVHCLCIYGTGLYIDEYICIYINGVYGLVIKALANGI